MTAVENALHRAVKNDQTAPSYSWRQSVSPTDAVGTDNAAQLGKLAPFADLLHELYHRIVQPPQERGRPLLLLANGGSTVFTTYTGVSGQGAIGTLRWCRDRDYLNRHPHYHSPFI
jgi:hypothetical protein